MKAKKLLLSVLMIGTFFVQSLSYAQNLFNITNVALLKTGNNTKSVMYGQSPETCIQVLGQPTRIADEYSEIDNANVKVYLYGSNRVSFFNNKLVGFQIVDATISIGTQGGQVFKINDKITTTTVKVRIDPGNPPRYRDEIVRSFLTFPLSKGSGNSRNMNFKTLSLNYLKNGSTRCDCRLELLFNTSDQLFNIALLE